MRKFLRWLIGVDKYVETETLLAVRKGIKSVNNMMWEEVGSAVTPESILMYVRIEIDRRLGDCQKGALDQAARDLVASEWEKQFSKEEVIDDIVDRIRRKQLK